MTKGFTLIELLLVIALISLVGASTIPVGSNFLVRNYLKNKTNEVVASLRTAQLNSLAGKEDSRWGVKTTANQIILFKGSTYAGRDSAFDQLFAIPGSITITQTEVVFNRLTGNPVGGATTLTVASVIGSSTVVVNAAGTVNVN